MKVLLIDNYDSFTYNLVHYLEKMDVEVEVVRNDQNIPSLEAFDALVLSPGPGLPKESGKLMDVIANAYGKMPILGICLGMQILADHSEEGDTETHGLGIFRGRVTRLPRDSDLFRVPHVGWNTVESTGRGLFLGTNPNSDFYFTHGYYLKTFDEDLEIFYTDYGIKIPAYIRKGNVHGVQFHPEKSDIDGLEILNNFAKLC